MRCFHGVDDNMSIEPHVTATTTINEFRYGLNLVLMDPLTPPGGGSYLRPWQHILIALCIKLFMKQRNSGDHVTLHGSQTRGWDHEVNKWSAAHRRASPIDLVLRRLGLAVSARITPYWAQIKWNLCTYFIPVLDEVFLRDTWPRTLMCWVELKMRPCVTSS
jgi:hypothetical protein